jgi:hypothetical protein
MKDILIETGEFNDEVLRLEATEFAIVTSIEEENETIHDIRCALIHLTRDSFDEITPRDVKPSLQGDVSIQKEESTSTTLRNEVKKKKKK